MRPGGPTTRKKVVRESSIVVHTYRPPAHRGQDTNLQKTEDTQCTAQPVVDTPHTYGGPRSDTFAYTVTNHYQRDSLGAEVMQHIRVLRSLYDSASGAKQAYHSLVTRQLQDQLLVACMWHRLKVLHSTTVTTYYTAKRPVATIYRDSATAIGFMQRRQHTHRTQELYHIRHVTHKPE